MARKHGVTFQSWVPLSAAEQARTVAAAQTMPTSADIAWVMERSTAILRDGTLARGRGNRLDRAIQQAWADWRALPDPTPSEVVACAS